MAKGDDRKRRAVQGYRGRFLEASFAPSGLLPREGLDTHGFRRGPGSVAAPRLEGARARVSGTVRFRVSEGSSPRRSRRLFSGSDTGFTGAGSDSGGGTGFTEAGSGAVAAWARCGIVMSLCLALAAAFGVHVCAADQEGKGRQPPSPDVEARRVRGIIDKDQSWSGTVIITDDVAIQDAIVTVNPGTTVEFAQASPGSHPTLTVGTTTSAGGELKVLATAQQPVTFRTREGTNPGQIVVNVRKKIVFDQPRGGAVGATSRPASVPNDLTWRYVRFERLGYDRPGRAGAPKAGAVEAAVVFNVVGGAHKLQISNCSFAGCARVEIHAGAVAGVGVADSSFSEEAERAAVQVLAFGEQGKGGAAAELRGNVLSAGLSVEGAAAVVAGNIVVGSNACIVLRDDSSQGSRIVDNYVHNTTKEDEGRYCLNCEDPAVVIENNIFRGGTMCVLSGSRKMSGNVIIGAGRLDSRYVKNAKTHQLVAALPSEATFERNLLLGPAHSLLVPQPPATKPEGESAKAPTIIRHNLFDGFGESSRAIHLNPAGRVQPSVAVMNNVFLRVPTLVYDEAGTSGSLQYADYNAAAPTPRRAFDQASIAGVEMGKAGWGAKDVRFDDIAALRLAAVSNEPPADFDGELLAKKSTVEQVRKRLFDAYRPLAGSPLKGAGRAASGGDVSGKEGCSIGPTEPGV